MAAITARPNLWPAIVALELRNSFAEFRVVRRLASNPVRQTDQRVVVSCVLQRLYLGVVVCRQMSTDKIVLCPGGGRCARLGSATLLNKLAQLITCLRQCRRDFISLQISADVDWRRSGHSIN